MRKFGDELIKFYSKETQKIYFDSEINDYKKIVQFAKEEAQRQKLNKFDLKMLFEELENDKSEIEENGLTQEYFKKIKFNI